MGECGCVLMVFAAIGEGVGCGVENAHYECLFAESNGFSAAFPMGAGAFHVRVPV